ncbi:MAG: tetratricopeptide repeat protein, partial [Myxococcales bacterium]|nr:tetratricopeptide repeat protein [Myxococcales bacterium]
ERGHFAKAERLARQAIRTEPRTGRYHLLLGDSLRRQAEYAEARTEYETARDLGHPSAEKRLRSLEALTQGG